MEQKRICKRCLLREYDEKDYKEKIERVLKLMKEKEKVPGELYEKRLQVCGQCEKLAQGTCLSCGCYVELRAAARTGSCPCQYWEVVVRLEHVRRNGADRRKLRSYTV